MNWDNVRNIRNKILEKTDWTQCADVQNSMSSEDKELWIVFRQKLRDITKDFSEPDKVIFPDPPYKI